jgi:hypothetical protein
VRVRKAPKGGCPIIWDEQALGWGKNGYIGRPGRTAARSAMNATIAAMAARLVGTGVELMLFEEAPFHDELDWPYPGDATPEDHAIAARVEAGTVVRTARRLFVELEEDGRRFPWAGGWSSGPDVDIGSDPTSVLVAAAYDAREDLGQTLLDFHRHGDDVTRFELYAAPFRIVLSEGLQKRLATSWKRRPPRV